MLYIASDHGGFEMKGQLVKFLEKEFGRLEDLGPFKLNPKDDYPKFAGLVAQAVAGGELRVTSGKQPLPNPPLRRGGGEPVNLGILICRSGQGVCMAANRFPGVRAALVWNVKTAKASRQDDLANILCLSADHISITEAKKIAQAWLQTPWGKDKRFERRAAEMDALV